jgi:hypothetical protein
MAPEFEKPIHQLPLIPANVLKKHHVHEPLDTRFRSAARLLQALASSILPKRICWPVPQSRRRMVMTDPPYNIPIDGFVGGKGSVRHREFAHTSGEMSFVEFLAFLAGFFTTAVTRTGDCGSSAERRPDCLAEGLDSNQD